MNDTSSSRPLRGCVFIGFAGIAVIVALGLWFAFGSRMLAEQWSVKDERIVAISSGGELMAVAIEPYKSLVYDGLETPVASQVEVRNVDGGSIIAVLPAFAVRTGAFSSDGQMLATGAQNGVAQVWQLNTSALLHTLQAPLNPVNPGYVAPLENMTFSADNHVIMANEDRFKAHIWRVADGALLRSFPARYAALHPSGEIVATSDDASGAITLWRVADGQQVRVFTPVSWPRALAWSPDGQWLAAGSLQEFAATSQTGFVEVWQLASPAPQPAYTFIARNIAINRLAFSADSALLAAAGGPILDSFLPMLEFWPFTAPDQIHLWQLRDGALRQTIFGPALQLQFSADGQHLYAVDQDNLYRWQVLPLARWQRWGLIGGGVLLLGLAALRWRRRRLQTARIHGGL